MRKGCMAIAALMLAVAIAVPLSFEDSDAGTMNGLMLYQVNPYGCEGVAVHNYGSTAVDMLDYTIADMPAVEGKEGTVTFTKSIPVGPGETLVVASDYDKNNRFATQDNTVFFGKDGVKKSSSFNLNNSGDDVYLFKNDRIVDAMCYGNVTISDSALWTGGSVTIAKDKFVQRVGTDDTGTSADWKIPGQTAYIFDPDRSYDATVTPFTFPESGGIPVYQTIESAQKSILIEIYLLTSKNMLGLLADKAEQGVEVRILLEGEPLGYSSSITETAPYYRHLVEAGAEIRFIGVADGKDFDRFDYVHAKFAVVDGDTTIVTSENWVTDNLNGTVRDTEFNSKYGNRGWGSVIESDGYAGFMTEVFDNDWSMDYGDVATFTETYPKVKKLEPTYERPADIGASFRSFNAEIVPVLSNDSSYDALEYYASKAIHRLYTEQQSIGSSYQKDIDAGPLGMFAKAAERGVDTKLIFSTKAADSNDSSKTSALVADINAKTMIEAAMMTAPYVHNKGVVSDDTVWVSSVNWTDGSFFKNRESCAVIRSAEVADYFASYFLKDFQEYYAYDGIKAFISELETSYESGSEITVTVNVTPSGKYTYVWDLGDGSEPRTTTTNRIVASPADGTHVLKVTVTDSEGSSVTIQQEYSMVPSEGLTSMLEDNLSIVAIIILILIAVIGAVSKKSGSSKKKKKGKKR